MTQTKGRHRAPQLSIAQMADLARTLEATCAIPPSEYRIHPDDWDEVRRMLPPAPIGLAHLSLCADIGIGSPSGHFTELRIILDVDAPRLPLKGGAA